jgi:hypothetical protein
MSVSAMRLSLQSLRRVTPAPLARFVARSFCTPAAEATAKPGEGFVARLLREGQVDSGFYQGAALIGGAVLGVQMASESQKSAVVKALVGAYRSCGLEDALISDRVLIEDFVRKNVMAACNVVMASPAFYFLFAAIHQQPISTCVVRSITGTLRIVPFMGTAEFHQTCTPCPEPPAIVAQA